MNTWLSAVVVGGLFYVAGQYIALQPTRIQQETEAGREITVTGDGRVFARPDIAEITVGVSTGPQATAERAMTLLTERFTAVVEAVREAGVEEKDITTSNFSLNPQYDFQNGQQTLRGY